MSWPKVKLSEVATLINGRAYKKHEMLSEGKYPLMRVGNFFSNRKWYYSDLELPERQYCDDGDLLYAWSASFGPRIWDGGKVIYHYHIWKLVLNEERIHKKYLYYALQRDVDLIKQEQGSGSTMIHVTKTAMEEREIPLPPLDEQKRIAAILDKANAIRRKRQQAIDLADDFLRSVFLDMFGDPVTNPKGWEVKYIKDLCDVSSGSTPSRKNESYFKGEVPWVKTTEVDGYEILDTEEHISAEALKETSCKLNPIGSVVLAMYGQGKTRGKVGLLGVEAATNQACAVIRPSEKVDMFYLYNYLKLSYKRLRALGQGGGQPNLNVGIVKGFEVLMPPKELQVNFVKVIKQMQKLNEKNSRFEEGGELAFNSLSRKAFTGEL